METFDTKHPTSEENMSFFFHVSMWWRIFYGFLRVILGSTLLKITGQPVHAFIYDIMEHELTGKTTDIVLGQVYTFFEIHDFTITYFLAGYFIFWGTIDIVLSLCLIHRIRRAFPIAMGIITLFIFYGIVRLTFTHSLTLFAVILIDFGILYLISHEYRKLKRLT